MFQKLIGIMEQSSSGEANIRLVLPASSNHSFSLLSLQQPTILFRCQICLLLNTTFSMNCLHFTSRSLFHRTVSSTCFHTTQLVFSSNIVRVSDMSNIKQKYFHLIISSQPRNFRNNYVPKYSNFLSRINSLLNVRKLHKQSTKPNYSFWKQREI